MPKPTDLRRVRRFRSRIGLTWLGLTYLGLTLALLAPPAGGAPFGADPERAEALLELLGDRYEVLTLTDGYVLRPTGADADFAAIEVKAGSLAVDGETVSPSELEDLVGDDAAILQELAELASVAGPATEELRQRIERLARERRLRAEEIEELVRSRATEELDDADLEAIGDALEKRDRSERERRRGRVRTDTRVSFGSSLTIDENETSRDVVVLGGSLDVEGKVRGDAVVVGGSAEVRGEVSGTVTAVGGSISLGPGAVIRGDAVAIGGAVHRAATAEIYGEITEVSLGPDFDLDDMWDGIWIPTWHMAWLDFGFGDLVTRVGKTVLLGVLLLLLVLLFPRLVSSVADRIEIEPWKAGLVGLGTQLFFLFAVPVIFVILLITIVGIPLALILMPLATFALIVLFLLGFAGMAMACGRLLQHRFNLRGLSPYLLVVLGLFLIQGWSILGEALGFLGGPIRVVAWSLLLLGFLIKYVAWTVGLGAILLRYLSPRPAAPAAAPPPLPPPVPADWEDTRVQLESQEEPQSVDEDGKYLRAAGGPVAEAGGEPAGSSQEEGEND